MAAEQIELIELLFFAYRGFTAEPDAILAELGFGRAHHRVLHFIARNPGLKVAELLDILRITKQSLARVLKDLIDKGLVRQRSGTSDRRERLLYASETGQDLVSRLIAGQSLRLAKALRRAGPEAETGVRAFLRAMIDAADLSTVEALALRKALSRRSAKGGGK